MVITAMLIITNRDNSERAGARLRGCKRPQSLQLPQAQPTHNHSNPAADRHCYGYKGIMNDIRIMGVIAGKTDYKGIIEDCM